MILISNNTDYSYNQEGLYVHNGQYCCNNNNHSIMYCVKYNKGMMYQNIEYILVHSLSNSKGSNRAEIII